MDLRRLVLFEIVCSLGFFVQQGSGRLRQGELGRLER